MYDIDKIKFGKLIAELRKEKGLKQKDVAQKLYVSDKAVSKWECGSSLPDITLLIPLAELLEVTVMELLEGERKEETDLDTERVVRKAIQMADTSKKSNLFQGMFVLACILYGAGFSYYLNHYGFSRVFHELGPSGFMCFCVGIYSCFMMKEQLPVYYDEHQINYYSSGIVRIHIVGLSFNNSNWPYIVNVFRVWSVGCLSIIPWLWNILSIYIPFGEPYFILFLLLLLIFCIYYVGKKYE